MTGVVQETGFPPDEDGDAYIHLALDPSFAHYLTPANQKVFSGNLHVEVICYEQPALRVPLALLSCLQNPDPFRGALPQVGQHVWIEGRYVLDTFHEAWAELHPLYRWGTLD